MKNLLYSAILLTLTLTVDARTGINGDSVSVTIANNHTSATFTSGKAFDILSMKSADGN